jgi:hypothetical protein
VSAPVITRGSGPRTQERPTRIPAQRRGESAIPAPAPTAAQRAYARRDDRARRLTGAARPARPAAPPGRAQFVLLVMVLLGTALVATLWLSTAAAADSYRLRDARVAARTLGEQSARLQRQVAEMVSPPALAQRAMAMGMVPAEDVARLVVLPDGAVEVVGEPSEAVAPPRAFPSWPSTGPSTEPTERTEPTESTATDSTQSSTPAPEGAAAAAALIGVGPGAPSESTDAADQEDSEGADGAGDAEDGGDSAEGTDGTEDTDAEDRTGTRSGDETDTTDSSDTAESSDTDSSDAADSSDSSDSADRTDSRADDSTAVGAATAGTG